MGKDVFLLKELPYDDRRDQRDTDDIGDAVGVNEQDTAHSRNDTLDGIETTEQIAFKRRRDAEDTDQRGNNDQNYLEGVGDSIKSIAGLSANA